MKFSGRESIHESIEDVFLTLSDFSTCERSAIRRGAEVQRVDTLGRAGVGAQWNAQVMMRGTQRNLTITLTGHDQPNTLTARLFVQSLKLAKSNLDKRF